MTDSGIPHQGQSPSIEPRKLGQFNVVGCMTLIQKECARFMNVYLQTVITPLITTALFYAVFALAFGGASRMVEGIPYLDFLAPGLIMMSMMQNAFANTSSSLMISKVQGNIVDVLMPPLSALEIMFAYAAAGVVRGIVVGLACVPAILIFTPVHVHSVIALFTFGFLGCLLMAMMGIGAGLWSEKFDHLAAITNFVVMPMTFLSGTFYSMHSLPPIWQALANVNPFFFMIDGFRYGMTGLAESNLWNGFGLLLVMNVGLFIFTYGMIISGYKTKS